MMQQRKAHEERAIKPCIHKGISQGILFPVLCNPEENVHLKNSGVEELFAF
jgi:hypothetical protein